MIVPVHELYPYFTMTAYGLIFSHSSLNKGLVIFVVARIARKRISGLGFAPMALPSAGKAFLPYLRISSEASSLVS
jgi:hypothetical protein